MKKLAAILYVLILMAALLTVPGVPYAEKHNGGQAQHKTKGSSMHGGMKMMRANMGMMAEITAKIYQLMSTGQMDPEEERQILDIMNHMSQMMREMSVPHGDKVKKQHNIELKEMRKRAAGI